MGTVDSNPLTALAPDPARQRFDALLATALQQGHWQRLILAKPTGGAGDLQRVVVRPITLKGQTALSFVYSHATRDITKNLAPEPGLVHVAELLATQFRNAHLFTPDGETQLLGSKKGRAHLAWPATPTTTATESQNPAGPSDLAPQAHDRQKHRQLDIARPFLTALGITTAQHQLVPAMARKWKQINKFLEIFEHALDSSALAHAPQLKIVDFGAGKAYLSFAVHDWLHHTRQRQAEVVGVELREDLVLQGQRIVAELGLQGMRMEQGDVREWRAGPMDVMIALHACDTATDHAIHLGIRSGAQLILCSPCCHKQLRPQLLSPHPLRSVFQHGIHAEQQAEMLTDSLRALLLEAQGYDTQVFEFVSLEHTRKNKMILAVKRRTPQPSAAALQQVDELKRFFGIREQCLESLLQGAPVS
jgi:Methyltransferase domain